MADMELENLGLEQIVDELRHLGSSEDRMSRAKEVEGYKAAFYRALGKLKADAELSGAQLEEKYTLLEGVFKEIYADYKKERAEFNKTQDAERVENLKVKQALLEELKTLVDSPLDDVNSAFPKLNDIRARWKQAGPVPAADFRFINDSYQFLVEKFYDMVKINHDLRDLDFKKNLEAKQELCQEAEELSQNPDVVAAFAALQKLHEQWKELGPVAKEVREDIWNRFKAATSAVNKAYQNHFEELKAAYESNLKAKEELCEKVEAIANREDIADAGLWNSLSKEIEQIQAQWKTIGYASRKDNQKIYDRLRAACDKFYENKKQFFASVKEDLNVNIAKKEELIAKAAELKNSTDWKAATDQFISLQKQWKEIGGIPRKKAEQLWARFRSECDYFFAQREQNAKPENDFYGNLKAKKALIAQINAFEVSEGVDVVAAYADFTQKYNAIGHVPYKEKDNIAKAYKDAIRAKFPEQSRPAARPAAAKRPVVDPKADAVRRFHALEAEIATLENNKGFFGASQNAAPLIAMVQEKIDAAKAQLKALAEQIRNQEING